mgnify:CR=1 FL=1
MDRKPIKINNIEFNFAENVSSYSQDRNNSVWNINKYDEKVDTSQPIEVILFSSSFYHDTIGHFFYDGFIYMQYFSQIKSILKEKYNIDKYNIKNVKVHLHKNPKYGFKKLFLELFDISEGETLYIDLPGFDNSNTWKDSMEEGGVLPKNNICLYSDIFCCHDQEKNKIEGEKFKSVISDYRNFVNNKLDNSNNYIEEDIDVLLFTRTNKKGKDRETYHGNDRLVVYDNLIEHLQKIGRKVTIYNPSDDTDDLLQQFNLVRSCNCFIVEYGAGFFQNGLFAKDIVVIDDSDRREQVGDIQHVKWEHLRNIYEVVEEGCDNITFLSIKKDRVQTPDGEYWQYTIFDSELDKIKGEK